MATRISKTAWVKSNDQPEPGIDFYNPKADRALMEKLALPSIFDTKCQKVCSKTIDLLPQTTLDPATGKGWHMVNVDGFRYLNVYVIADSINSSARRGCDFKLSFSVNDFVYGTGVVGETSYFFNFEDYYNTAENYKRLVNIGSTYTTTGGGLTQIGGVDYTYLVRIPVMGPYVRATAMNRDSIKRTVSIKAYLTT